MTKFTYKTKVEKGQAMRLDDAFKMIDTVSVVIVRNDGQRVWATASARPERTRAKQLQANRSLAGFRDYHRRVGRCWFDDELSKKTRELIKSKHQGAKASVLRDRAGDLWRAAQGRVHTDKIEAMIGDIDTAIAEAQNEAGARVVHQRDEDYRRRNEKWARS